MDAAVPYFVENSHPPSFVSAVATHDHEEAFTLADRVAILNSGEVEQFARPAEIAAEPASEFVRQFLA